MSCWWGDSHLRHTLTRGVGVLKSEDFSRDFIYGWPLRLILHACINMFVCLYICLNIRVCIFVFEVKIETMFLFTS